MSDRCDDVRMDPHGGATHLVRRGGIGGSAKGGHTKGSKWQGGIQPVVGPPCNNFTEAAVVDVVAMAVVVV